MPLVCAGQVYFLTLLAAYEVEAVGKGLAVNECRGVQIDCTLDCAQVGADELELVLAYGNLVATVEGTGDKYLLTVGGATGQDYFEKYLAILDFEHLALVVEDNVLVFATTAQYDGEEQQRQP